MIVGCTRIKQTSKSESDGNVLKVKGLGLLFGLGSITTQFVLISLISLQDLFAKLAHACISCKNGDSESPFLHDMHAQV